MPNLRWQRCDPKTIQLLGNVLARPQAVKQDAVEAILLRDGQMIEGAASNLFIIRGGVIHTKAASLAT
ncbi:MAG: aminotransferase class IV [Gammaproteobacteria bacterium]|nr:aminotransferase class IV [Gammaproteobacteria bacterium]